MWSHVLRTGILRIRGIPHSRLRLGQTTSGLFHGKSGGRADQRLDVFANVEFLYVFGQRLVGIEGCDAESVGAVWQYGLFVPFFHFADVKGVVEVFVDVVFILEEHNVSAHGAEVCVCAEGIGTEAALVGRIAYNPLAAAVGVVPSMAHAVAEAVGYQHGDALR